MSSHSTPTPPAPEAPALPPEALPDAFRPPVWARNPHLQTLAGKYLRPEPDLPLGRERWETADGDFLDLDFLPDGGGPVVLVLHGLEGHTRRRYMLNTFSVLGAAGFACVGLNFRSCSGEPNRTPRAYHSGETGDLALVMERLRARFPNRALAVVGFSLGGNMLLKYLGERGHDPPALPSRAGPLPDAAVAVSVPFDLAAGADLLGRSAMGRAYTRYFLSSLREKARRKAHLLRDHVPLDALERVRTLRGFDDLLTAPVHGFRDADDYYARCSSGPFLPAIRTPTLVLHAVDDPFLPATCIPRAALTSNPWLHPVLPERGGHVGFVRGSVRRPHFWGEAATVGFLTVLLAGSGRGG
ncbi:MAG: alpha/beta fold hydrolase [Longimicrobiales bacterium]|nr:alpha/beta fold hydrolase [Longimicrobiales bacterium]